MKNHKPSEKLASEATGKNLNEISQPFSPMRYRK